jgi:hypothetical protein
MLSYTRAAGFRSCRKIPAICRRCRLVHPAGRSGWVTISGSRVRETETVTVTADNRDTARWRRPVAARQAAVRCNWRSL